MISEPSALLPGYPVVIKLPVQWGDQDAFGHVNNTVYFRWFESARLAYLEQAGLSHVMEDDSLGPILASIKCDYRRQLTFPDTVEIGASITRIGRSSMVMRHVVISRQHQAIVAEGESTIVAFDYREISRSRFPTPSAARSSGWKVVRSPADSRYLPLRGFVIASLRQFYRQLIMRCFCRPMSVAKVCNFLPVSA